MASARFSADEGIYSNRFGRSNLVLDTKSGAVKTWEPYSLQSTGRQDRSWIRFTHTGETGGFIGQLLAMRGCIDGLFLVWTGFALSLHRFNNRKRNITE